MQPEFSDKGGAPMLMVVDIWLAAFALFLHLIDVAPEIDGTD